jgi:hypothetical protein
MQIRPGQIYESAPDSEGVVRRIRITRYTPGHARAHVTGTDGKRFRQIRVTQLHTDGKPRKTGYQLLIDVTDTPPQL